MPTRRFFRAAAPGAIGARSNAALMLVTVVAAGLLAMSPARADWFGGPFGFGFDSPYHPGGPYRGSPYVVSGWGDDGYRDQRRYWGGPFWVDYRGHHPPYESYGIRKHRKRHRSH
jgi:hypothetical protein